MAKRMDSGESFRAGGFGGLFDLPEIPPIPPIAPFTVAKRVEPARRDAVAHARKTNPETSHEAAASVKGIRASQAAVLSVFRDAGRSMCDDEMERLYLATTGLPQQSESGVRTRRKELVDAGKLRDTGQRTVLPSGRRAILWGLTRTS